MRDYFFAVSILCLLSFKPLSAAEADLSVSSCPKETLFGQVQSTTKVSGEVVIKRKWVPIPENWGPHGGAYHKLKVTDHSVNRLVFVFKQLNEKKQETVQRKEVSVESGQSDFSLTQWLDETPALQDLSGRVHIYFFKDDNLLCRQEMAIQRSELP